jgi:hypothetical protein
MQEQLYSRLKNCLQTILDLEPDLARLRLPDTFRTELEALKMHLERVRHLDFREEDLRRLETATEKFLEELRLPFAHAQSLSSKNRVLQ